MYLSELYSVHSINVNVERTAWFNEWAAYNAQPTGPNYLHLIKDTLKYSFVYKLTLGTASLTAN